MIHNRTDIEEYVYNKQINQKFTMIEFGALGAACLVGMGLVSGPAVPLLAIAGIGSIIRSIQDTKKATKNHELWVDMQSQFSVTSDKYKALSKEAIEFNDYHNVVKVSPANTDIENKVFQKGTDKKLSLMAFGALGGSCLAIAATISGAAVPFLFTAGIASMYKAIQETKKADQHDNLLTQLKATTDKDSDSYIELSKQFEVMNEPVKTINLMDRIKHIKEVFNSTNNNATSKYKI